MGCASGIKTIGYCGGGGCGVCMTDSSLVLVFELLVKLSHLSTEWTCRRMHTTPQNTLLLSLTHTNIHTHTHHKHRHTGVACLPWFESCVKPAMSHGSSQLRVCN